MDGLAGRSVISRENKPKFKISFFGNKNKTVPSMMAGIQNNQSALRWHFDPPKEWYDFESSELAAVLVVWILSSGRKPWRGEIMPWSPCRVSIHDT